MTLVMAITLVVGASYLLNWLNFPAGALIGAMVAIGGLKLSGVTLPGVPGGLRFVALMVIGWDLGSKFNKELLATV
ncbi:MAG: AbrB family transcriptional regulator, partial [Actinomycetota bacterium]